MFDSDFTWCHVKSEFYHIQALCKSTASPMLMLPARPSINFLVLYRSVGESTFTQTGEQIATDRAKQFCLPVHSCCTYLDAITSDVFKILKWFWGPSPSPSYPLLPPKFIIPPDNEIILHIIAFFTKLKHLSFTSSLRLNNYQRCNPFVLSKDEIKATVHTAFTSYQFSVLEAPSLSLPLWPTAVAQWRRCRVSHCSATRHVVGEFCVDNSMPSSVLLWRQWSTHTAGTGTGHLHVRLPRIHGKTVNIPHTFLAAASRNLRVSLYVPGLRHQLDINLYEELLLGFPPSS